MKTHAERVGLLADDGGEGYGPDTVEPDAPIELAKPVSFEEAVSRAEITLGEALKALEELPSTIFDACHAAMNKLHEHFCLYQSTIRELEKAKGGSVSALGSVKEIKITAEEKRFLIKRRKQLAKK